MAKIKILMTAGEASADRHASRVIKALKAHCPDARIFGMGGPEMEAAGMECSYSIDELSVMGFTDVLPRLYRIFEVYKGIKALIEKRSPDIFIPIDLPDFNMHLAGYAKTKGVKVLYYIAPQAWAWRRSRAFTLSKITDGLAVIFPFEHGFFSSYGVNTRYVGHPMMEDTDMPIEASWPVKKIGILPGSRIHEIEKILPVMLGAKRIIQKSHLDISWHLPAAPGIDIKKIAGMADRDIIIKDTMPEVDLAMVKSGTATFETAVRGVPEVICYKTSHINYHIAKMLMAQDTIGMPNIILGKKAAAELIQDELTPLNLSREITRLIEDRDAYQAATDSFRQMRDLMGSSKASEAVAGWIMEMAG